MKRALVLLVLAVCVAFAEASNPEMEVRQALAQFVQAFDNLDRDRFAGFFSDDATMFQPRRFVSRAESRREIESQFRQIFPGIRRDQTKPPYMDIQPRDLRVQMVGMDVAVVTFHLHDRPNVLNRRTIVWQRTKSGWKIIHNHTSEVAIPATP
jgi:ketosteroid isomerase-like protein